MIDLAILVEGETERDFVTQVLQPYFAARRVSAWPMLPGKPRNKPSKRTWPAIALDIHATLSERDDRRCTTMFDLYALPSDWPGLADIASVPRIQRAARLQEAIQHDFASRFPVHAANDRFIPYIQSFEFEALLFSEPAAIAREIETPATNRSAIAEKCLAIRAECGSPEEINDRPDGHPSARLNAISPGYDKRKRLVGPRIAAAIGLEVLRRECPHFNAWIRRLESLAT